MADEKELAFAIDALEKLRGCIILKDRNHDCDKRCKNYAPDAEAIIALDIAITLMYHKKFCMGSVQDPY